MQTIYSRKVCSNILYLDALIEFLVIYKTIETHVAAFGTAKPLISFVKAQNRSSSSNITKKDLPSAAYISNPLYSDFGAF